MSRIYLLDDHPMMRDGLRATLEGAGHEIVGESGDLAAALDELSACPAEVAIVDLSLGRGATGFQLLAALQQQQSPVRCIVLTMSAQASSLREALRLGALGYVLKGSRSSELIGAIDAVLQGRTFIGEGAQELAVKALNRPVEQSPETLSARERQVVAMVVEGLSSARIGEVLGLSTKTVETYRSRVMTKLGLGDIPSLVRWAIREGLIDAERP